MPNSPHSGPRLRSIALLPIVGLVWCAGCDASQTNIVRPLRAESDISPELQNFRDAAIETQLRGDVRPAFPTVLAVAKLTPRETSARSAGEDARGAARLEIPRDAEAAGWHGLCGPWGDGHTEVLVEQVQIVTPLLVPAQPESRQLREAAAALHAPLLLVYTLQEDHWTIQNQLAALYWTIIGLWCVPGHSVGTYSTYHGLFVDTQTGFVLATVIGQAGRQEDCLPGNTGIVENRTRMESRAAAMAEFQRDVRRTIAGLARQQR